MELPLEDDSFIAFVEESREHLETFERLVLELEKKDGPPDDGVLRTLFRAAHTIKGTAGFFAVTPVTELGHALENLLVPLRSHEITWTADVATLLLESSDALGRMLQDLSRVEEVEYAPLLERLLLMARTPDGTWPRDVPTPKSAPDERSAAELEPRREQPMAAPAHEDVAEAATAPASEALEPFAPASFEERPAPSEPHAPDADDAPHAHREAEGQSSVRVNLAQLNRLMMAAGELVLTRNALLKKAAARDLDEMIQLVQRVHTITSELQDGIMATRMQPVGVVFTKFRRIVRDLARQLGKQIELTIEGEEVELDKSMLEAIGGPLTHLVRNSADHGLEPPAERLASGKPIEGVLRLRAFHEAGQVVIEVIDDGRGIDPEKIAASALKKGLYTREQLDAMSLDERLRIIFVPGFSTAAAVTDVSGRGVGMDVVLTDLSRVGGTVDIRSHVGRGTTIVIRLPLTLAIIPSLLVGAGELRFAIPQVNLLELVRIAPAEIQKRVERLGAAHVLRLRDELLPLVRLSDVLELQPVFHDPSTGELRRDRRDAAHDRRSPELGAAQDTSHAERRQRAERRGPASAIHVAVLSSGPHRFGLVVDELLDTEEIVVKPLGVHLQKCREYAGVTILGDGTVALILDVQGLAQVAELGGTRRLSEVAEARRRQGGAGRDALTYLMVENGPGERFAMPLGLVQRIEKLRPDALQQRGGRLTATFGDTLLPLLAIEEVARVVPRAAETPSFAIILALGGREVGILVSQILDIVEGSAPLDAVAHVQPGILGSTVIDDHVVLLLDVHTIVDTLLPELKRARPLQLEGGEPPLVLVVEDSPFFRKQIVAALDSDGFRTVAAEDGALGLELLDRHADEVRLVVTDIEMPNVDGLEMTRRIRKDARFSQLPILACTSLSGEAAEARGREAGLTEYLVKLDRDQILDRSNHHLHRTRGADRKPPAAQPRGDAR